MERRGIGDYKCDPGLSLKTPESGKYVRSHYHPRQIGMTVHYTTCRIFMECIVNFRMNYSDINASLMRQHDIDC